MPARSPRPAPTPAAEPVAPPRWARGAGAGALAAGIAGTVWSLWRAGAALAATRTCPGQLVGVEVILGALALGLALVLLGLRWARLTRPVAAASAATTLVLLGALTLAHVSPVVCAL